GAGGGARRRARRRDRRRPPGAGLQSRGLPTRAAEIPRQRSWCHQPDCAKVSTPNSSMKGTQTMRWTRPAALSLALILTAAACGEDDASQEAVAAEGEASEDTTSSTSATPTTVTIEHYSGTDEVPVQPETVV